MTPLPWHQALWSQVQARQAQKRLPQAVLLAGARGLGKELFARQFAALLLCESMTGARPCGTCRSCTQLGAGTHPNALLLSTAGLHCLAGPEPTSQDGAISLWLPDKDSKKRDIGVDGIRNLIERLGLSSHYGQARMAAISPADSLNGSGINMLLKTVEEPPPATHLLLIAERWRALPATLRSRCELWRFTPPPPAQALAWLRQRHPQQPESALKAFVRCPLRAAQALDPEVASRREEWARALGAPRHSLKLQGLKREDAEFGLECWLETVAGWMRQRLAPRADGPAVPAAFDAGRLTAIQQWVVEGLRGLERNGNPALIVESIMIRSAGDPAREHHG